MGTPTQLLNLESIITNASEASLNHFTLKLNMIEYQRSLTPYFRNYFFNCQTTGDLKQKLATYTSKTDVYRYQVGIIWNSSTNRFRTSFWTKKLKPQFIDQVKDNLHAQGSHFLSLWHLQALPNLWFGAKYLSKCQISGLTTKYNWLAAVSATQPTLNQNYNINIENKYQRLLVNTCRRGLQNFYASGNWARLQSRLYAYGTWHRRYPKRAKLYRLRRLLFSNQTKKLLGVLRTKHVVRYLTGLSSTICGRVESISLKQSFRLSTILATYLKIPSLTKIELLIRNGHVFVDGKVITNTAYSVKALSTVTVSFTALRWINRLLRHRQNKQLRIGQRVTKNLLRRRFNKTFNLQTICGPRKSFIVVCSKSNPPNQPYLLNKALSQYTSKQIRFILASIFY